MILRAYRPFHLRHFLLVAVIGATLPALTIFVHAQSPTGNTSFPDAQGHLLTFDRNFNFSALTLKQSEAALGGTAELPVLKIKTMAKSASPGVILPAPGGSWDLFPTSS